MLLKTNAGLYFYHHNKHGKLLNNTVFTKIFLLFLFIFLMKNQTTAQLSGTYLIGKSAQADFATLAQAIDSLNANGISSPVVFKIEKGIYNAQLTILQIKGADSLNTITFESLGSDSLDVVLENRSYYTYSNFVLNLMGTDYITFRKITFRAISDTFSRLVLMNDNATHVQFENCLFLGKRPLSAYYPGSSDQSLIYSPPAVNSNENNLVIKNSSLINGYIAIELNGNSVFDPERDILIQNCYFLNQFSCAIAASQISRLTVVSDRFENLTQDYFSSLELYSSSDLNISHNLFYAPASHSGTIISLYNCLKNKLQRNIISNNVINYHSPVSYYLTSQKHAAFYANNCTSFLIAHNTVRVSGDYSKSKILMFEASKDISVKNNIFCNLSNGYLYYFPDNQRLGWDFSNNVLYSNVGTPVLNWQDFSTISTWKSITSLDSFSFETFPDFHDKFLLRTGSVLIDNKGIRLPEVITDYHGNQRDSLHPDPGAFEFASFERDLMIGRLIFPDQYYFCQTGDSVRPVFQLVNQGNDTVKGFTFYLKPDANSPYNNFWVADTIFSQDTFLLYSPISVKIPATGKIISTAFIQFNGDQNPFNDTFIVDIQAIFQIRDFPFRENFDKGYSSFFHLKQNQEAALSISGDSYYSPGYVLHFQGGSLNTGWVGGFNSTSPENAWKDNYLHHSFATSCLVVPGNHKYLRLSFKLRQTFSFGQQFSWFRVLVNDSIPLPDINGKINFNPYTNHDLFQSLCFDLTPYCPDTFTLTFQAACRTFDKYYQEGDNVFVDDVEIIEIPRYDACITKIISPFNPVCADSLVPAVVKVRNLGSDTLRMTPVSLKIKSFSSQQIVSDTVKTPIPPGASINVTIGKVNLSSPGKYEMTAIVRHQADTSLGNDSLVDYLTVNQPISLPVTENFEGPDSLKNWKISNMWVSYPGHHDVVSYSLSNSIWTQDSVATAIFTSLIGPLTSKTYLSFDYRIVSNPYPFSARVLTAKDSLKVLITDDCNRELQSFFVIDSTNHQASSVLRRVVLPLKKFDGKRISFAFRLASDSLNMNYIDIDSVVIAELPDVDAGKDTTVCPGTPVWLTARPCTACSYRWVRLEDGKTVSDSLRVLALTDGNYVLKVTDSAGWSNLDTVRVSYFQLPEVNAGKDKYVCTGDTAILMASGAEKYVWDGWFASNPLKIKVFANDFHFVKGISREGCVAYDTVFVYALKRPQVEITGPDSVCYAEENTFYASGADTYYWNSIFSAETYTTGFKNDTVIRLLGFNQFGCSDSTSKAVRVKSLPMPHLGNDTVLCADKKITLSPGNFQSYLWHDQSFVAVKTFDSSGTGLDTLLVWVKVWQNGCSNTDSLRIIFKNCSSVAEADKLKCFISPNPFSADLNVLIPGNTLKTTVNLYDGKGVLLKSTVTYGNVVQLNTSGLPEGFYCIAVRNDKVFFIQKVLKIKEND
ncbi:MAG TPA: T9SS type A sorting domain-containing protein [Bacteroidia bacterium]|nr:T9SS type A sorting domain-containing protein [Bacteroidia bacterium]